MPHYHNFSWYYFAKYVLGFASIFFLYSGFLKEKYLACTCAAEERELARRKEDNNESCPTGDQTDALVERESIASNHVDVDANGRYPCPATTVLQRRKLKRNVLLPRNVRQNSVFNNCKTRNVQLCEETFRSHSSSDGKVEIIDRKKHRPGCHRALKRKEERYRNSEVLEDTSSQSSRSTPVLPHVENNCNRKILDAVGKANIRVRNSFVEQEHRELEALACSIFSQNESLRIRQRRRQPSQCSRSSSSISFRTEAESSENRETRLEDSYESPSYNLKSPEYHEIHHRKPFCHCRKHHPESPSSSFASNKSRSGSIYLTASSRGKRVNCKIHGCRCRKNIVRSAEKRVQCSRVEEEFNEPNAKIAFASSVNRRKPGKQRVTRYRSTTLSML